MLAAIVWRFVTADFDWVYGQWWTADRIGLALMGVLAMWRPIGIVPFVVQLRVLQTPLSSGFGFALGVTPDGLPLNALAAVAATAVVAAMLGHRCTSMVVSLLSAATAIEFFVSGRLKLEAGWVAVDDLSNFPLNGYHQGWLGRSDGELASALSTLLRNVPLAAAARDPARRGRLHRPADPPSFAAARARAASSSFTPSCSPASASPSSSGRSSSSASRRCSSAVVAAIGRRRRSDRFRWWRRCCSSSSAVRCSLRRACSGSTDQSPTRTSSMRSTSRATLGSSSRMTSHRMSRRSPSVSSISDRRSRWLPATEP